jgi:hypothetical protein
MRDWAKGTIGIQIACWYIYICGAIIGRRRTTSPTPLRRIRSMCALKSTKTLGFVVVLFSIFLLAACGGEA